MPFPSPSYPPSRRTIEGMIAGLRRDLEMLKRRPESPAGYNIKCLGDLQLLTTGDGLFYFEIDEDLNGYRLHKAEAYLGVAGTGTTTIQLYNQDRALDMLSTRIQIDSTERKSINASVRSVVNETNALVSVGDMIRVDVDAAATGGKGLGLRLRFRL
jgi:hypothetical protein